MGWRGPSVPGWLIAFGGTAGVTAVGRGLQLNPQTIGFAFLIIVLLASLRGGLLSGVVASIVSTLCYNFFFFPPLYTFVIHDESNWVALAAFVITSVVVSRLVLSAQTQGRRAEDRRTELETLYSLSIDLFSAANRVGALGDAARRALTRLGAREGGLVLFDGPRQNTLHWTGEASEEIAGRIAAARHQPHAPMQTSSSLGRDVYLPLVIGREVAAVLVARGTPASLAALVSASRLIALALERERLLEKSAHVEALRQSEELKTSLLRAISHDLTTPLTAITIHTEALRRKASADEDLKATVGGITSETARLRRRIDNLLAMARLEAGRTRPHPEPTPPADLFRAARENLPLVFESRRVVLHVDDDCPDVYADPSLLLEVLVNLIENAHRASPADAPLDLIAQVHPFDPSQVRLEIRDRGPGLPAGVTDEDGSIVASATGDVAQRGLGLEIARSLTIANGGTIGITPRAGGGTVARVDMPAARLPVASTGEQS